MKTTINNPLMCDPESGVCEMPGFASDGNPSAENRHTIEIEKPVRVLYFTDPICSSCWGIEPQLRKLKLEYGDHIQIDYKMGGLLPSWDGFNGGGISKPSDVAHHWDEVSQYYQMPIDGDVWLEDPLDSSYPPSIAFKAAQLQDEKKAVLFLRRMREMVFLEKKNITKWEHIEKAASEVGLDIELLRSDFDATAQKDFQDDLALARKLGIRGFPTIIFTADSNCHVVVNGSKPYENYEEAVLKLSQNVSRNVIDTDFDALFAHYPTLTTKEFATLTDVSLDAAEQMLGKYFLQKRLTKTETKNGVLWKYGIAAKK